MEWEFNTVSKDAADFHGLFFNGDSGRHGGEFKDFRFACVCVEDGHSGFAEHPATRFAGIDKQSTAAIADDTGAVCVSEHDDVGIADAVADILKLMTDEESQAIGGLPAQRGLGECADDGHSASDTDLVTVVITKAGDDLTVQFSHGRDDERRHEVTRQQHRSALHRVEQANGMAQIIDIVMNVGEDPDFHWALGCSAGVLGD